MKKVLLFAAIAFAAASFTSCKKECKCTLYVMGIGISSEMVDQPSSGNCSDLAQHMVEIDGDFGKNGIECK